MSRLIAPRRVAAALVLAPALVGAVAAAPTQAAVLTPDSQPSASLTLTPTSKSVTKGSTVTMNVVVDTGGQAVNTVQVWLTFPDQSLDCSQFTKAAVWTGVAALKCDSSSAALAVYKTNRPITGKVKVGTVVFATVGAGSAPITFDRDRTFVASSDDNSDILASMTGATIRVR